MPLSYLSVEANTLDGKLHSVQLYSDISAGEITRSERPHSEDLPDITCIEWVSGDRTAGVKWSTSPQNTGTSLVHQIQLQSPTQFTENSDQAEDSTVYYGIAFTASAYSRPVPLTPHTDG